MEGRAEKQNKKMRGRASQTVHIQVRIHVEVRKTQTTLNTQIHTHQDTKIWPLNALQPDHVTLTG